MENKLGFAAAFHRVKQLTGWKTQQQLCEFLEVTSASVSGAKKRDTFPPSWAVKIARKFDSSTDWLLAGKTDVVVPLGQGVEMREYSPAHVAFIKEEKQKFSEIDTAEVITLPIVEARLSAGTCHFEASHEVERYYAFRQDFLQRKGQAKQMVLMRVTGESMAPEIRHGDMVLIDQSQKDPNPGQICAVGIEGLVYLKRIDTQPGKLILHSINAAEYPPFAIDLGETRPGVVILGRCIWSCREFF